MAASMIRDMTKGPVVPQLCGFALPLFVSNALQAVYNLVDLVIVGNYVGPAGMAAVSIGGDVLHLLTFAAMGFCSAGQVLIARSVGSGSHAEIRKTIGTMFTFLLVVALGIAAFCWVARHALLRWLNTPPEAEPFAMDYLVTCACGLVFIYGYNVVSAILRGMGDSRRPFVFIAVAALLNIALDVLFIKYWGLAVLGAALATVIGQGASFVAAVVYLYRRRAAFGFDFRLASFRPDPAALWRLFALGGPMAVQSAAIMFSKVVLAAWINQHGVTYAALAGIFNKVNTVCGVVSQSFTMAGSTMAGQNLAAREYERVRRALGATLAIGLAFATAATLALALWPATIYGAFTPDAEVLAAVGVLTLPVTLNFYGAATRSASFSLLNGSGRSGQNLAVAILDGVVSRIGLAAWLGFGLGLGCSGFWLGDALAGFMPLLIGGVFYLSGSWRREGRGRGAAEGR